MTIDEAIVKYRNRVKQYKDWDNMKDIADEHEQLTKWLEELKEARKSFNENRKAGYKHGYSEGYNKAIDDFVDKVYFVLGCDDSDIYCKETVNEIAEQLKA